MTLLTRVSSIVAVTAVAATPAFAQYPGEAKPARSYDPVGDMQYTAQRLAASDQVREVQRALHDRNYYNGPIDGVLGPELRTAIWNFQRAKGLPLSARLDPATLAALDLPAVGAASPGTSGSFGSTSTPPGANSLQAP